MLDAVIELKVNEDSLIKRIENRVAEMTARGEKVRADDTPDVLAGRLAAYRAQTAPLVDYYAGHGALRSVDGMTAIDQVTAAIDRILAPGKAGAAGRQKKAAKAKPGRVKRAGRRSKKPKSARRNPRVRKAKRRKSGRNSARPLARKNKSGRRRSGPSRRLTKRR